MGSMSGWSMVIVLQPVEAIAYIGPASIMSRPIAWPGRRHSMMPPTSESRITVALNTAAPTTSTAVRSVE